MQATIQLSAILIDLHAAGWTHRNISSRCAVSENGVEGPWKLSFWDHACVEGHEGAIPDDVTLYGAPEIHHHFEEAERVVVAKFAEDVFSIAFILLDLLLKALGYGTMAGDMEAGNGNLLPEEVCSLVLWLTG